MIVGTAPCRAQPLGLMQGMGYQCAEVDDVYAAMLELCRRPLVYRSLILTLSSLFREELLLIPVVKKRFPHVDIYVTGIEGRQAALAEAMRLGAAGLLADDGLHPTGGGDQVEPATPAPRRAEQTVEIQEVAAGPADRTPEEDPTEPVLTAEELQALLEEHEPSTRE